MVRIFGPKREEVGGGSTRLHNEELHNLCVSPNRVIRSRRMRSAYKIVVGKPEVKRPHGRPIHRWEVIAEWILEK